MRNPGSSAGSPLTAALRGSALRLRSARDDSGAARGEVFQYDAAKIVLLDEARTKSRFRRREADRFSQQHGILLVQADRHAHASPFTTTPQRRLMLPRLGDVGIQGIKPVDRGNFFSSLRSSLSSTPSRSSSTPTRLSVPMSP